MIVFLPGASNGNQPVKNSWWVGTIRVTFPSLFIISISIFSMIWYVYLVQEFKFVCVPLNFATYLILEYAFYLKDHSYESKDISVCF